MIIIIFVSNKNYIKKLKGKKKLKGVNVLINQKYMITFIEEFYEHDR
jgi:hypothetical protein